MHKKLYFFQQIKYDMQNGYDWYEARSSGLGERFISEVEKAIDRLRENPKLFAKVHKGIRRSPVLRFPYGVFFREEEERVVVMAVAHLRRDPDFWKQRID